MSRLFALSDIHVDYDENFTFLEDISAHDYANDLLILPGDISHIEEKIRRAFDILRPKFDQVLFVPGNHDLWISTGEPPDSLVKFDRVNSWARESGITIGPSKWHGVALVPIWSWYDFGFGQPVGKIRKRWNDFRMCKFPDFDDEPKAIFDHFIEKTADLNDGFSAGDLPVVTYSHFMPRLDILPIQLRVNYIYGPVLGGPGIDTLLRSYGSSCHVYGHSHINISKKKGGVHYINNALGYPNEGGYTRRRLFKIKIPVRR